MFPVAAPVEPAVHLAQALEDAEQPQAERSLKRAERRLRKVPDDPGRRLRVAFLLALSQAEAGPWCHRTEELLAPLTDTGWTPWRETVSLVVSRTCAGEAWPSSPVARLRLAEDWESALGRARLLHGHPLLAGWAPEVHADLLEARASLHFAVGDHELAVLDLREAIALRGSPDLRLRLGLSLMALEQEPEARAQLTVGLLLGETQPMLTERARMALHVLATPDATTTSPLDVGESFPDLELTVDGARVRLHDLEGPMVVDLWATWCEPCIRAMPHLAASAPGWADRGVRLIGLSVDEHDVAFSRFIERGDPGYPTAWAGPDAMAATHLGALPAVFVLDERHRVVGFVGGWSAATARHLESLVDIAAEAARAAE